MSDKSQKDGNERFILFNFKAFREGQVMDDSRHYQ